MTAPPAETDALPLIVGIDPGVNTGCAVWDIENKRLIAVFTSDVYSVQKYLSDLATRHPLFLILEDARLRKVRRSAESRAKAQGAGAIKIQCTLWDIWTKQNKMPMCKIAPGKTWKGKFAAKQWKIWTGWQGITNDHGRDAASMVFGVTNVNFKLLLAVSDAQLKPKVKKQFNEINQL